VTTYTYNLDGTVQQVAYTNAQIATPSVSYTYDPVYSRVATMVDGTGTTSYAYQPAGALGAGQVASVDRPLTNDTITYTYDELGRVVSRSINGAANSTTQAYRRPPWTGSRGAAVSRYAPATTRSPRCSRMPTSAPTGGSRGRPRSSRGWPTMRGCPSPRAVRSITARPTGRASFRGVRAAGRSWCGRPRRRCSSSAHSALGPHAGTGE
jgi:YD repeat-containing protein